jgi:hypothetical protein
MYLNSLLARLDGTDRVSITSCVSAILFLLRVRSRLLSPPSTRVWKRRPRRIPCSLVSALVFVKPLSTTRPSSLQLFPPSPRLTLFVTFFGRQFTHTAISLATSSSLATSNVVPVCIRA